jgi:hypothetical protein
MAVSADEEVWFEAVVPDRPGSGATGAALHL